MNRQVFLSRHLRLVLAAALTTPVAITLAASPGSPAQAALGGVTPFEIDSNTIVNTAGNTDWVSKFAAGQVAVSNDANFTGDAVVQTDVGSASTAPSWLPNCPSSNTDTVFKNSTSITDPDWTGDFETQSVTNKADICQSYFAADVVQSGARAGHIIAYIAFTRRVFNGDASLYFILSKGPNPDVRVAGDIVIEVDYGSQGDAQGLRTATWGGTPLALGAPTNVGVNNPNVELSPVQYFAEMAIDLTALNLAPNVYELPTPQSCQAFGFGRVISRTGNSPSATLKDDGEPSALDFNVCGALIVKKQLTASVPGTSQFPIDITAPAGVTLPFPHPILEVPGGTTNGGTPVDGNANPAPNATPTGNPITYNDLPPRIGDGYNVWEPLAGQLGQRWDLVSIVCVNDKGTAATGDDMTTIIDDPSDEFALLTLETVTCTITNSPAPAVINVDKLASGQAGSWPVTLSGAGSGSVNVSDDGTNNFTTAGTFQTFGNRAAGSYTLTEGAEAGGGAFRPTGWSCTVVGGATTTNSGAAIAVNANPGDVINCTITNTPVLPPDVVVTKTAAPTSFPETETTSPIVYTVDVHNAGTEPFTITDLTDAVAGGFLFDLDLAVAGDEAGLAGATIVANDCGLLIGQSVAGDATKTCHFSVSYVDRNAGDVIDDEVIGYVVDAFGRPDSDDGDASVTVTDVLPVVLVDKLNVQPVAIVAPGGSASYTITITNPASAVEPITLTAVTDTLSTSGGGFGPTGINYFMQAGAVTATTCSNFVNTELDPGEFVTCQFTIDTTQVGPLAEGDVLTNRVDVTAEDDDGNEVDGSGSASRTVLGEPPTVDVFKTDNEAVIHEPGEDIAYDITIANLSITEPLTITSITDEVEFNGSLVGTLTIDDNPPGAPVEVTFVPTGAGTASFVSTTCDAEIGTILGVSGAPDDETSCTITLHLNGNAGDEYHDVVTVTGEDDEGTPAPPAQNEADTPVVDVLPTIMIDKVADKDSVPETGGVVTYTLTITNTSVATDPLTITALSDDKFGTFVPSAVDVPGTDCDDLDGVVLDPGESTTCTIVANLAGPAETSHDNIASVTGEDDEGNPASDSDNESVEFEDVLPAIVVTKTANDTSVPESGQVVTFTVTVENATLEPVSTTSLFDDVDFGVDANLVGLPGSTCLAGVALAASDGAPGTGPDFYTCTFTRNVAQIGNELAHHDIVTVTAEDDEENEASANDDETVTFELIPPTVTITKTDEDATVDQPGGDVTYTIDITNESFEPVTVTTLTDTISYEVPDTDTEIDLLDPVAPVSAFECHDALDAPIDIETYSLAPGETVTCSFVVSLAGTAQIVRDVVNVVVIDNDNQTDDDQADESTPILAPDISVTKTIVDGPTLDPTTGFWTIVYEIAVSNTGSGRASIDVNDQLKFGGGVVVEDVTVDGPVDVTLNNDFDGDADTLIAADVAVLGGTSQTYTITVVASIPEPVPGQGACDPESAEDGGFLNTVTVDTNNTGDVDDASACAPFSTLTLVKEVTNDNGGNASPTDFALTASANGLTFVEGNGSATAAVPAGSYTLAETPQPGYAASASGFVCSTQQTGFTVTVPEASEVTCTITNNDQAVDLQLTKSDGGFVGTSGQQTPFPYTITVQNLGPRELDNEPVTVVDDLPAALEWVAPAPAGCAIAGQQLTCAVAPAGLRPVGTMVTITATARLKAGTTAGTYDNRAYVTTQDDAVTTPPPCTDTAAVAADNNVDCESTPVNPVADVAIIKSASVPQVGAGGGFTWLLDVTNNGPDPAVGVVINDIVPGQVTVTGVTSAQFSCSNSGNTVTCTKASMAVGETGAISIAVTVPASAASGTVTNIGTVTASTPDNNPANNSDDASVTVVAQAPPLPPPPPVILPPTGSNSTTPVTWAAISLVLIGGVVMLVSRRRRDHTSVN